MTGIVSGLVLGGVLALSKFPGYYSSQAKLILPRTISATNRLYRCQIASMSTSVNLGLTPSSFVVCLSSSQYRTHASLTSCSPRFISSASLSRSSPMGLRSWGLRRSSIGLSNRSFKDFRRAAISRKIQRAAQVNIRSMAEQSEAVLEEMIKAKNSENAVVLYAKTWCPYCGMVKNLFDKLGVNYKTIELDELVDEIDVQDALTRLTGQSTVPNVFIGGKHIGGCDDTMELHERGELVPALKAAGATVTAN